MKGFGLAITLFVGLMMPMRESRAVMMDTVTVYGCSSGTLYTDSWGNTTCVSGGGYDGGTGGGGGGTYYEPVGGGGGGGSLTVTVPGRTDKVNLTGTKVWTDRLGCGDELDLRQNAVQYAVLHVNPEITSATTVTLYMTGSNEVQQFHRVSNSGSYQFAPTSACVKS